MILKLINCMELLFHYYIPFLFINTYYVMHISHLLYLCACVCFRFRDNEGPDGGVSFFFTEVIIIDNIICIFKSSNCSKIAISFYR